MGRTNSNITKQAKHQSRPANLTSYARLGQPRLTPRALLFGFLFGFLSGQAPLQAADIQIVDLEDIDFGVVPPTVGDLTATAEFCVPMDPRGRYSLIGRGSGPAGSFQLTERGTSAYQIEYMVQVANRGRSFVDILSGIPLNNQRASRMNAAGRCQPTSRLLILISSDQLQSAAAGRYEGTLRLLVAPE